MRHHIDLIESATSVVPDFTTFVTPQLIDHLLEQGQWTSHGSSLEDWWEEGAADYYEGDEWPDMPFYEALAKDRNLVRATLAHFVQKRAEWINRVFNSGDHGIPPVHAHSPIQRAICVSDAWIAALGEPRRGAMPLGIYWGTQEVEPWGSKYDDVKNTHPHVVEVTTSLDQVSVDWEQTFMSRLDWTTGDEEHEIQLFPMSPINHVSRVMFQASNSRPDLARMGTVIPVHPSATFIA